MKRFSIRQLIAILAVLILAVLFLTAAALASSLSAKIDLNITANYTKAGDLSTAKDRLEKTFEQLFSNGTGSGQANTIFSDERSLADGANESLDLAGGLTDAFGATITLTKVKLLIISNKSSAQTLSVGGAASNGFATWVGDPTDIVKIGPGATAMLICDPAGVAVTAGTGDLLKILNSAGAACAYDIIIIGN